MEVWKRYDGKYDVSNYGTVRNKKGLIKITLYKGYLRCSIHSKPKQIHQLVAICFLDHIPCGYKIVVDHKDNNPLNNNLSNLQLISQRENASKDIKRELPLGVYKNGNRFQSRIDFNGRDIYLGTFDTPKEASEYYKNALKSIENGTYIEIKKHEFSSKFKGVSWHKRSNKWRAIKNSKHLGSFNTEIEAFNHIQNYSL